MGEISSIFAMTSGVSLVAVGHMLFTHRRKGRWLGLLMAAGGTALIICMLFREAS